MLKKDERSDRTFEWKLNVDTTTHHQQRRRNILHQIKISDGKAGNFVQFLLTAWNSRRSNSNYIFLQKYSYIINKNPEHIFKEEKKI